MSKVHGGGVPIGTQLNGIYEIDERVAMGGMGEVYIGHNIQTGDKVAIKMILPEHAHNQIILDLFRREASTLNRLSHEAIVRYYVFSVDPTLDRPYLAMEYAGGPSLADRLRERPLNEAEVNLLRRRVASGLAAAHRLGVFHRDISPDNVILLDGEVAHAKIIDFGIAKSTSAEGTLIGGGFAGKLNYVSPEQLGLGGGEVTGKSDIYSLGLVLAEAAIGRPLPMGGTQVEVLEKRRTVPSLDEVPAGLRPLIEWMLQPDPEDRPADMDEVAAWGEPVREPTVPPSAASRRRGTQPPEPAKKRGGLVWVLGGIAVAAAAGGAAFFLMLGEEKPKPKPETAVTLSPATQPAATAATLAAPGSGDALANPAFVGSTYTWVSPPFDYSGDAKALQIVLVGSLPEGLEFENGGDGTAVVYGIPKAEGAAKFQVKASSPEGKIALMGVALTVKPARAPEPAAGPVPTPPAPTDTAVAAATAPAPAQPALSEPVIVGAAPTLQPGALTAAEPTISGTGGAGGGSVGGAALSGLATAGTDTVGPALAASPLAAGAADPGKNAAEPSINVTVPTLSAAEPTTTAPSLSVSGGGGTAASGGSVSALPSTGAGAIGPALSTLPLAAGAADPGKSAAEPVISATAPTLGLAGTGGGDTSLQPAQPDLALAIPRTGAVGAAPAQPAPQPVQPVPDKPVVAAIPPTAQNLPPKILDRIPGPIEVNHGDTVNLRLGAFDDEDGASRLALRVDGRLPNGLQFIAAAGGVAQLYGAPNESGNFSVEVVAVDPEGLVSSFPVSLSIASPLAFRDAREYILGYDGGRCFLSRPMQLGEQMAQIEVFAANVDPVIKFDSDFKRDRGFEANIGMRPISPQQCGLIGALDQVGTQALDNRLVFRIVKDELKSGETLEGTVEGAQGARLFLYDNDGGVTDLTGFTAPAAGGTAFKVPLHAEGPQILVATVADPASGLAAGAGLEELLGAAKRGQASLALGFIMMAK